ncbi:MAG: methyltransferase [Herbinix sp.]|jgi:ubiquinone/menaquinone biosynthesis C-methylase UbiE|nr:methyltransferase [Herbinix sp.]
MNNQFEKLYTVDDIAQMTMLTSRTIRNYLKDGLLTGRKVGGQWRFTAKDIEGLFANNDIEDEIKNLRRQEIMDFLDGINTDMDGDIQICSIIDYYCSEKETAKLLHDKFQHILPPTNNGKQKYYYEYIEKEQKARYTFFGTPRFINNAINLIEIEWNSLNSALSKFTDKAEDYEKYRPSYPKASIDLIFSLLCKEEITIADIGSGTGKLSELLLQNGATVYAVEPNDDMRIAAEEKLKLNNKYQSLGNTAEKTGLLANSIDLITCGECYHWFDNEKTKHEFHRILKPGGYVCLIWNNFGDNAYSKKYNELYERFGTIKSSKEVSFSKEEMALHLFGEGNYHKLEFDNTIYESWEAMLGGSLSASYAPKPDDKLYPDFVRSVKAIYDQYSNDGLIEAKFKTICFYGQL